MKIEIVGTLDRGQANKECLFLRILSDTNLSFYVVIDSGYTSPTTISNVPRHSFWFPSKQVKAGETVFLYTGPGLPTEFKHADGTTGHIYYWGNDKTLWNKPGDCAVLFEVNTWITSKYE